MGRPYTNQIQPGTLSIDSLFSSHSVGDMLTAVSVLQNYINNGQSNLLTPDALTWMQANAQTYLHPGQPSTPAPAPVSAPTPASQGFVASPDSTSTPVFNPQGQVAYIQNGASVPSGWSTTVPTTYSGYSSTYSNQAPPTPAPAPVPTPAPAPVIPPSSSTTSSVTPDNTMIQISASQSVGASVATPATIAQAKAYDPNQPGLANVPGASTSSAPTIASLGITAPPSGSSPTTTMPTSGLGSTAMTNQLLGVNAFDTTTGAATGTTPTTNTQNSPTKNSTPPLTDKTLSTDVTSNQKSIQDTIPPVIDKLVASGVLSPGQTITPAMTGMFLQWAHQYVDPQTQQLINTQLTGVNNYLKDQGNQFNAQQGADIQQFAQSLATLQNQAGVSGRDSSGGLNLASNQLEAGTNRTLSSLLSSTNLNVGNALNQGASQVGSQNANQFNLPTIAGGRVSVGGTGAAGGTVGGFNQSGAENNGDFGYNPNAYAAGVIPSTGSQNVANQQAQYIDQYTKSGINNPTQSIQDLLGGLTNKPAGATIPTNLS